MSLFSKLGEFFKKGVTRQKRDREWGERFDVAGNANDALPLEPEKDPWRK